MSNHVAALRARGARWRRQAVHPPVPAWMLHTVTFVIVLAVGATLRFVGLDWDQGQHQHPDERFLSTVLLQIEPAPNLWTYFDPGRSPLNPFNHDVSFFVYGTFPLFLVESLARVLGRSGYDEIYLVGRTLSALFDLGTVGVVYLLARRLLGPWPAVVAAALLALTVHSIQIAHFLAVDTFATFFATLTLWLLVRYSKSREARTLGLAGIATGLAMASKLSTSLLLLLFAGWWTLTGARARVLGDTWARRGAWLAHLLAFGVFAALGFRLFQPYAFAEAWPWDWRLAPAFTSALAQQQAIQTGTLDWPPGIQWAGTIGWFFPLEQFVRWGAGPSFGLAALAGLGLAAVGWWRTRNHILVLPLAWGGLNFLVFGAFVLKTMRYFHPVYPVLALVTAWAFAWGWKRRRRHRLAAWVIAAALATVLGATALWALAFTQIYGRDHSRVAASAFIYANAPPGSTIAVEHWDDALPLPLDGLHPARFRQVQVRVYDPDREAKRTHLIEALNQADLVVLASDRGAATIPRMPQRYPLTARYYAALDDGSLGFDLLARFESRPSLGPWVIDDRSAEEAFSVYDHPTVSIYARRGDETPADIQRALGSVDLRGVVQVLQRRGGRDVSHLFSEHYACADCGTSFPELEPRVFSFNSPHGACPDCGGLGTTREVNGALLVGSPSLSILEGAIIPWGEPGGHLRGSVIPGLAAAYEFDPRAPWRDLPPEARDAMLMGSGRMKIRFPYNAGKMRGHYEDYWEGVVANVDRRYRETSSEHVRSQLERYMSSQTCAACEGSRLGPFGRSVRIGGATISSVTDQPIGDVLRFIRSLPVTGESPPSDVEPAPGEPLSPEVAGPILKAVRERLGFLRNVGLDYLSLSRSAATLSGGESQRIRLATQIGSRLVGVLYILDEPSIGLHQRDNHRLLDTLKELRDLGNSVLVVEHDEDTIREADFIVDLGPGAGLAGGEVVAAGSLEDVQNHPESVTGAYLRGDLEIPLPKRRRRPDPARCLTVRSASQHNLKHIDAAFPLGCFIAVTGVSGSGKSTLVNGTLYRALSRHFYRSRSIAGAHDRIEGLANVDKVIEVDQSPIGRTPRSNPATYTGLFTPLRQLFAGVPEAQIRGYLAGRFSFNVKGGRCDACKGDGLVKIEMHFLPDVYVSCDVCKGRRYNRETLDIYYKGRNISDVLRMTVHEALEFFSAVPQIKRRLQTLADVGLGYIRLGQSATTLSGGEAQRIKLSAELSKKATGRTMYILDEPTTGLHFEDVRILLRVLHRLVERGNTVVVIEHNLHVVKTADWIIDLGPEGGEAGGRIVVEGTPERVADDPASYTGQYLAPLLAARQEVSERAGGSEPAG